VWKVGALVNMEELDPDPFMELMPRLGLSWHLREGAVPDTPEN
jgi:carboxynorspermidine synthase